MEQEDFQLLESFLDGVAKGNVNVAPHLELTRQIAAVKRDNQGAIDPSTVAPEVLTAARFIGSLEERRALKQLPLEKIQGAYFDILQSCFGEFRAAVVKNGVSPHQVGQFVASQDMLVEDFAANYEGILDHLTTYWRDTVEVGIIHVEEIESITLAYHGSLVPDRAMVNTAALTAGTIVVPDPLMKLLPMHRHTDRQRSLATTVRCGIEMLGYRDLATAALPVPLLVVTADRLGVDPDGAKYLEPAANEGLVGIASAMFATRFSEVAEVSEFLGKIDCIEELAGLVRNPDLVLFDDDDPADLLSRLDNGLRYNARYLPDLFRGASPGALLMFHLRSRTFQAADAVYKAQRYGSLPYMDAPVSWQYFEWFLEYTSENRQEAPTAFGRAQVLPEAFQKLPGFLDLPPKSLIRLYREGALERIRGEVLVGLELWTMEGEKDPHAVMQTVSNNITTAINEYGMLVEEESKALSGLTSTSLLFGGNALLALAAAIPGANAAAVLGAAAGLWGLKSGTDVYGAVSRVIAAKQKLRRSAIGALFKVAK